MVNLIASNAPVLQGGSAQDQTDQAEVAQPAAEQEHLEVEHDPYPFRDRIGFIGAGQVCMHQQHLTVFPYAAESAAQELIAVVWGVRRCVRL